MRAYCPVGDLVAGMAYLVRRLLENTANESFLSDHAAGRPDRGAAGRAVTDLPPFANEPILELRRRGRARRAGRRAGRARARGCRCGCRCGSATSAAPARALVSTDPADPDRVVATAARGRRRPTSTARSRRPQRGLPRSGARAGGRARAGAGRARPHGCASAAPELAALAVRECAKPWGEADADVCEAIDFLEYYAREAIELDRGPPLLQVPGERNAMRYAPRGVAAVIAPWNFPLAIPLRHDRGRAGHRQRRDPQARRAVARLRAACSSRRCATAGVPPDALALLPGEGDVGAALVRHPRRAHDRVHRLGRRSASRSCAAPPRSADGQRHLKRVDRRDGRQELRDRRLRRRPRRGRAGDRAVSAFGYAGQKCSAAARVLAHEAIADALIERLAGAVDVLDVGPADDVRHRRRRR